MTTYTAKQAAYNAVMKPGTKIVVTWPRPEGDVQEPAKVARRTKEMGEVPVGYVPVRFPGGVLLIPASRIEVQ